MYSRTTHTHKETAIQDLRELAASGRYEKCAALVRACQSLREYFNRDEVFDIPEIKVRLHSLLKNK